MVAPSDMSNDARNRAAQWKANLAGRKQLREAEYHASGIGDVAVSLTTSAVPTIDLGKIREALPKFDIAHAPMEEGYEPRALAGGFLERLQATRSA